MSSYQPEIGQGVFGQPWQEHDVCALMDAALEAIRHELARVMWNLRQTAVGDPFGNTGASFACPTFTVCAYSWNDDVCQPYNFKHAETNTLITWYKYAGRGLSANRKISAQEAGSILTDCLAACKAIERGDVQWSEPGLYPDGGYTLPDDAS